MVDSRSKTKAQQALYSITSVQYPTLGYPSDRTDLWLRQILCRGQALIIRGRWASSSRGSHRMRIVWTIWPGWGGLTGLPARSAEVGTVGGSRMVGTNVSGAACALPLNLTTKRRSIRRLHRRPVRQLPHPSRWPSHPIPPSSRCCDDRLNPPYWPCFGSASTSRRVIGWAIADHMRTDLIEDALRMAIVLRGRRPRDPICVGADHPVRHQAWHHPVDGLHRCVLGL